MEQNKNSKKPDFLAFAQDGADRETLKDFALAHGWEETCIAQGDIATATEYLKTNPSPKLLLVEIPSAEAASGLLDALADVCDAGTKVIIIGTVNEYSFYCWLTSIGVFSYLLRPLTKQMLDDAYQKSITISSAGAGSAVDANEPTKIIAVIGARGGVGASTISLNLAGIFAEHSGKKIALVDVDPQQGTLALSFDIEPAHGLRDALEKPERIDTLFIDRVMSKPSKNLWVMSVEEPLSEMLNINELAAETILKEFVEKYEVVVLDIPRNLSQFSRDFLKKADSVVLVAELNLQSLRDTLRLSDLIRDTLKLPAPMVVINRAGVAPKNEISVADFEKGIGDKIVEKINYLTDVFMYIGNEIPAVTHAKNTGIKPLYNIAKQLLPNMQIVEEVKKNDMLGFLKKKK